MRILAHFTTDQEAAGDFWITLGEIAQVATQVAQFLFIVWEWFFQAQAPAIMGIETVRPVLLIL